MNHLISIPLDLQSIIGAEKIDFAVIAKRKQPSRRSLGVIVFGLFWTAFTSIFVVILVGPLLRGEEFHFKANGVPKTASLDNFQPMLVPSLVIGLFVLVGIGILFYGFYSLLQKGGYYVGTPQRLIHYYKGAINSYDWDQFTGNMEINNRKGFLALQLHEGSTVTRDKGSDQDMPDVIYISGIKNTLELAEMCRKRMKVNKSIPLSNS